MKHNATYEIHDTFKITGKGIIFAGCILEGTIAIGDYIEFFVMSKHFMRKIIGIEGINSSQSIRLNTRLLIETENEIDELRSWSPNKSAVKIFKRSA